MTVRLSKKVRDAATTLAVAYSSFNKATKREDLAFWAKMLQEAQNELGIKLHDDLLLTATINQN